MVHAAAKNSIETLRVLLKYGAKYDIGRMGGINFFEDSNCNIDSFVIAVYKMSIYGQWEEMVKELIKMGMPATCDQGVTPVDMVTSVFWSFIENKDTCDVIPLGNVYTSLHYTFIHQ